MSKFAIGLLTLAMYAASLPVIATVTPAKAAAATEHHNARKTGRKPARVNEQFRNSNNEPFRNSNVDAVCGIFPGPCQ
jgi:hypothetical protein